MKSCSLVLTSLFLGAFSFAQKPSLASLQLESGKTVSTYRVIEISKQNYRLEKTSNKTPDKAVKIPAGLAQRIKNDLLDLSWKKQYLSKKTDMSACKQEAQIYVEHEDTIKTCADQALLSLQNNLEKLLKPKKRGA